MEDLAKPIDKFRLSDWGNHEGHSDWQRIDCIGGTLDRGRAHPLWLPTPRRTTISISLLSIKSNNEEHPVAQMPARGLEPPRPKGTGPQPAVYTSSTTRATVAIIRPMPRIVKRTKSVLRSRGVDQQPLPQRVERQMERPQDSSVRATPRRPLLHVHAIRCCQSHMHHWGF